MARRVTLTYTVEVDDHHGGVTSQDIVVTVNGSNDAPEIANIAQQGLTEQTDTAPLTTTIPVTFTDRDLSDVGHSATITHAAATGATTGLALDEAALIALVTPGAVTKAAGSTAGTVDLSFSAASSAFDYLAQGEVLTLTTRYGRRPPWRRHLERHCRHGYRYQRCTFDRG